MMETGPRATLRVGADASPGVCWKTAIPFHMPHGIFLTKTERLKTAWVSLLVEISKKLNPIYIYSEIMRLFW